MPRATAAALALTFALAAPHTARGDPARPEGRIETDGARFEILGRPLRAGDRIELPEGTMIVEEGGPDDGQAGSFGIVPAESLGSAAPAAPVEAQAGGPADAAPGGAECRAERAAYLAELWRGSGVEVKDPVALLEGLEAGGSGAAQGFYWFAMASDAFRPLAWSSELRSRADAVVRCVHGHGG